ncbi:MAG: hypothetical protein IT371_10950 [Deltaproteobacteria bacterium]|nr:hypothetical protein [Deltaproteobacteria bacterium]
MTRTLTALFLASLLTGCYVYARPGPPPPPAHHYQPAPGPTYQAAPEVQQSQGGMTAAPAPTPAPAPQAQVGLSFSFSPTSVRRGDEVTLSLSGATDVTVWYNGRPLPKKVLNNGLTLVVTIPGDGASGYFELEWSGQRVRSPQQLTVLP